jgi:hypothetical protein
MKFATRCVVIAFAALVVLFCGTSAWADTFTLKYSGVGITGNINLTASSIGGGDEEVTSISGSQTIGATLEAISGILLPTPVDGTYNGVNFAAYSIGGIVEYTYDDLIIPGQTPPLDAFGLVFSAAGLSGDVNLCAEGSNPYSVCGTSADPYWELTASGQEYGITSLSLVQTPEPSTVLLVGFGLAALFFVARRKQFAALQI